MKRFFLLLLLAAACTKPSKDGGDNPPGGEEEVVPMQPLVLGKGTSLGTAVTASIGSGGGELVAADGTVKLTIPAGAVKNMTTFSIEPITDVLQVEETGKINYRLMPENVTFDKPVSVTMKYTATDVDDGTEDLLMMAHQDVLGKWQEIPTALDKANKTLTAEVEHFSDFTFYKKIKIIATRLSIGGNESTILQCGILSTKSANKDTKGADDDLLTPLTPQPPEVHKIRVEAGNGKYAYYNHLQKSNVEVVGAWAIENGGGTITPGLNPYKLKSRATYKAKGEISEAENATIKLELEGVKLNDPKAPGGIRKISRITINKVIKLLPSGYMRIRMDGMDTVIVPQPSGSESLTALANNGVIVIQGSSNSQGIAVSININSLNPRAQAYPCGNVTKNDVAEISVQSLRTPPGPPYKSSYNNCTTGEVLYSLSSISIDKLDKVGEFIEGSFDGPLYHQDAGSCTHQTRSIKVNFRIKRAL